MKSLDLLHWEPTAATLLGLAVFQLADTWTKTAPTITEVRNAPPGDLATRQKLLDAEMAVGTVAVVVGGVVTALTQDPGALVVMLAVFVLLAAWHHAFLAAEPR